VKPVKIKTFMSPVCLLLTVLLAFSWSAGGPAIADAAPQADETLLMFIGEQLKVVTAASRRPETPAAAPAVVTIVNRRQIMERGYRTLADLLAEQPGFFMAPAPEGTVPFLRGIPDGLLILYDGVPLTMEVAKNLHPLDSELSLNNVKQVEIIRGPGSVLWGPDAFAGIVNVVPLSGRNFAGAEVKGLVGNDNQLAGYGAWGKASRKWDLFIANNTSRQKYHDPDYHTQRSVINPGEELVSGEVSNSHFQETILNAHVGDWLTISGRYNDFKRRYTLHDRGYKSWSGEAKTPVSFIKANINQPIGTGHWSLTGYYQYVRYEMLDVDLGREQKNHIYHGELMVDQRLGKTGFLTMGTSYRENQVRDALVNGGFLPDFLEPENIIFIPAIEQADYNTHLWSAYAQYRHHLGPLDCWLGVRYDDHSRYQNTLSYSLGANWLIDNHWRLKAVGGTAYRSPYPSQIYGQDTDDPERITTLSLQLAWQHGSRANAALTLFYNRLKDHVRSDPYGGLSLPANQKIAGAELEGSLHFSPTLNFFGGAGLHHKWGEEIDFKILKAVIIRPDGSVVRIFENWDQPFNDGPNWNLYAGTLWRPRPEIKLSTRINWAGDYYHSYDKDSSDKTYQQPVLLNMTLTIDRLFGTNATLTLRGRNVLNNHYRSAGRYGSVEGWPGSFSAELGWRF